jgi:zinc transporter 9
LSIHPSDDAAQRADTGSRYVAMHAMQEENHSAGHDAHSSGNGYSESGGASHKREAKLEMRDTLATVVGFMLPLLTRFGHHHH